jgi:hypothetical protein
MRVKFIALWVKRRMCSANPDVRFTPGFCTRMRVGRRHVGRPRGKQVEQYRIVGFVLLRRASLAIIKAQFLENHGSAADCNAGMLYAVDNGWLEVTPTERDIQPRYMRTLTAAGFEQI